MLIIMILHFLSTNSKMCHSKTDSYVYFVSSDCFDLACLVIFLIRRDDFLINKDWALV